MTRTGVPAPVLAGQFKRRQLPGGLADGADIHPLRLGTMSPGTPRASALHSQASAAGGQLAAQELERQYKDRPRFSDRRDRPKCLLGVIPWLAAPASHWRTVRERLTRGATNPSPRRCRRPWAGGPRLGSPAGHASVWKPKSKIRSLHGLKPWSVPGFPTRWHAVVGRISAAHPTPCPPTGQRGQTPDAPASRRIYPAYTGTGVCRRAAPGPMNSRRHQTPPPSRRGRCSHRGAAPTRVGDRCRRAAPGPMGLRWHQTPPPSRRGRRSHRGAAPTGAPLLRFPGFPKPLQSPPGYLPIRRRP